MAGQLVRLLLQLCGMVIMARLLQPSDFGLVAMVMVIIGVAEVLRDFGLSLAAIQAPKLSPGQRSNLFWINTGIGFVLTATVVGLAWPISFLYGDGRLIAIAQVAAVVFLLNGASAQFRVALARELRFTRLAAIEVAAATGGLVIAVVVAASGGGYWAIVIQPLATAGLTLASLLILVPWLPGKYDRTVEMRSFLSFGGYLTLATSIAYASRNVDSLIVGLRYGATTLGYYDRAYQLVAYALGNLEGVATRVAQPVLRRAQPDGERFRRYLLAGQTMLLQGTLLTFGLASAVSIALIPFVFGENWSAMVPFFIAQLVAGAFASASRATYWCFLASGKTKSQLAFTLVGRPGQVVIIIAGSAWGAHGVATAYAVSNGLLWLLGLAWVSRWGTMPVREMFVAAATSLVGYGVPAVAGGLATNAVLPSGNFIALASGGLVFAGALGIMIGLWPTFRRQLLMLGHLRTARQS